MHLNNLNRAKSFKKIEMIRISKGQRDVGITLLNKNQEIIDVIRVDRKSLKECLR